MKINCINYTSWQTVLVTFWRLCVCVSIVWWCSVCCENVLQECVRCETRPELSLIDCSPSQTSVTLFLETPAETLRERPRPNALQNEMNRSRFNWLIIRFALRAEEHLSLADNSSTTETRSDHTLNTNHQHNSKHLYIYIKHR